MAFFLSEVKHTIFQKPRTKETHVIFLHGEIQNVKFPKSICNFIYSQLKSQQGFSWKLMFVF